MGFRVDLDIFRGPLDLLLYLVRKHELDVADIRRINRAAMPKNCVRFSQGTGCD